VSILAFPRARRQSPCVSEHRAAASDTRQFRPRFRRGTAGLFWLLPAEQQRQRIRDLHYSARLNVEQIATLTRLRAAEAQAIIEAPT
jgi:hypothetical protein